MKTSHRTLRRWRSLAVLTLLAAEASAGPAVAQERIGLGNGATMVVDEYLIETRADDTRMLVAKGTPGFDPEPFGQVPADTYARTVEPLCRTLVTGNWDKLEEQGITFVRVRWDFEPTKRPDDLPDNMSISRFHEMRFAVTPERGCDPMPYGVANLSPKLPSGVAATLKFAEPGRGPRDLALTYRVDGPISEISDDLLENAAIELCIAHGDHLLADRARYYEQLETDTVSVSFVESVKPGFEVERRLVFPVVDGKCRTGLSQVMTEAIRAMIDEADVSAR